MVERRRPGRPLDVDPGGRVPVDGVRHDHLVRRVEVVDAVVAVAVADVVHDHAAAAAVVELDPGVLVRVADVAGDRVAGAPDVDPRRGTRVLPRVGERDVAADHVVGRAVGEEDSGVRVVVRRVSQHERVARVAEVDPLLRVPVHRLARVGGVAAPDGDRARVRGVDAVVRGLAHRRPVDRHVGGSIGDVDPLVPGAGDRRAAHGDGRGAIDLDPTARGTGHRDVADDDVRRGRRDQDPIAGDLAHGEAIDDDPALRRRLDADRTAGDRDGGARRGGQGDGRRRRARMADRDGLRVRARGDLHRLARCRPGGPPGEIPEQGRLHLGPGAGVATG